MHFWLAKREKKRRTIWTAEVDAGPLWACRLFFLHGVYRLSPEAKGFLDESARCGWLVYCYGFLLPGFVIFRQSHPHGLTLPRLKNVTTIDGVQILTGSQERTSLRDTGIIVGIMLGLVAGLVLLCYTCDSSSDSIPTCRIDINEICTYMGIPVVIAT